MKRILIKTFFVGFALAAVPSFAQDTKPTEKEKKDHQQIIITRSADTDEKTVIEIKGDKVTVNGKDVNELKDSDVKVRVNKIKDVNAYVRGYDRNGGNFDFNFDFDHNNAMRLFSEDDNRAMLGIVTDSDEKGAKITSVSKEGAAEKAGLKKEDIITKIGDTKVEDAEDVSHAIRKHKPGDKVSITYLRGGKEQKATAELSKWKGIRTAPFSFDLNETILGLDRMQGVPGVPAPPRAPSRVRIASGAPRLGMSVQDTEDGKGVKVVDVDEDGNAAKAGLKEDDIITNINDKEVNTADEIAKEVRESREKVSVKLKILRAGKVQNIEVKIPRKLRTADL